MIQEYELFSIIFQKKIFEISSILLPFFSYETQWRILLMLQLKLRLLTCIFVDRYLLIILYTHYSFIGSNIILYKSWVELSNMYRTMEGKHYETPDEAIKAVKDG